jgi:hypothetical protein
MICQKMSFELRHQSKLSNVISVYRQLLERLFRMYKNLVEIVLCVLSTQQYSGGNNLGRLL